MACMKLGSKANVFHLEGHTWLCSTGLPSDVCIEVGESSFHLHKFPLLSRSQLLEKLIQDFSLSHETKCVVSLHDLPGGAESFLLVAKFCYGVKIELTSTNVVGLRCAAEYLQMTEDYGEGNLISQTAGFIDHVLRSWVDTIKALETCEVVLPLSEQLHIVSRCIDSLATKACSDPNFFIWPDGTQSPSTVSPWNEIQSCTNTCSPKNDWWHEDLSALKLPIFRRLILAVGSKGMMSEKIAGAVVFYAKTHLPLNGRQRRKPGSTILVLSDADQRTFIENILGLLSDQKGATPTSFLLRLLRMCMMLNVNPLCLAVLERRIGAQLDEALLQDLLIPNTGDLVETLYDVECVQRLVDHFLYMDQDDGNSNESSVGDEDQLVEDTHPLSPVTTVANLLDSYLAEVASDVNLKMERFLVLAASLPEYARTLDDGIYQAIDIYLKAHPWLTNLEREQLCKLMSCQKLSLEASMHAAQNERLPLGVIVQVLFFEQLRLLTFVAGWCFVPDNLENSQDASGNLTRRSEHVIPEGEQIITFDDMRERMTEIKKDCDHMKHEIQKLVKTKGRWINFYKRFGLKVRTKSFDLKNHKGKAVKASKKAVPDGEKSKLAH